MNHAAVSFALLAMLSWGVWAVLANVATRTIAPTVAMILSYATSVAVALLYVWLRNSDATLVREGVVFALAAGVFAGVGAVAFYSGLDRGSTGAVTTVSGLYFVVASVLGVAVLGEALTWEKTAGVGFAVLAVVMLAR